MPRILHILTKSEDALPRQIISRQTEQPGAKVEMVDLTQPDPDYTALLEKIFGADSVEVW